jgi:hypothetical protein
MKHTHLFTGAADFSPESERRLIGFGLQSTPDPAPDPMDIVDDAIENLDDSQLNPAKEAETRVDEISNEDLSPITSDNDDKIESSETVNIPELNDIANTLNSEVVNSHEVYRLLDLVNVSDFGDIDIEEWSRDNITNVDYHLRIENGEIVVIDPLLMTYHPGRNPELSPVDAPLEIKVEAWDEIYRARAISLEETYDESEATALLAEMKGVAQEITSNNVEIGYNSAFKTELDNLESLIMLHTPGAFDNFGDSYSGDLTQETEEEPQVTASPVSYTTVAEEPVEEVAEQEESVEEVPVEEESVAEPEESVEEPVVEEPVVEEPTEEPVEVEPEPPAEVPVVEPPTPEPIEEDEPVEQPVEQPVEEPVIPEPEPPAEEPSDEPEVEPTEEAEQDENEIQLLTPEEVEQMENEHMELLSSLREMTQEELFDYINPDTIAEHEKNGTLYILLLAINNLDDYGDASKTDRRYEGIIENVVEEGMELRKGISEVRVMSAEQLKEKLSTLPFSDYFNQEGLPPVNIDFNKMGKDQLIVLCESCLLEQQIRNVGIEYDASASFRLVAGIEGIERRGDCNIVANYYYSLASLSGSTELVSSLNNVVLDGHAQVCFDLGEDMDGNHIRISKNTSYVDVTNEKVDEDGRQNREAAYPYAHNFYDVQNDMDKYGSNMRTALLGANSIVASQIGELSKGGNLSNFTAMDLQNSRELYKKALELNPYAPTANYNYLNMLSELIDNELISKESVQEQVGEALGNFIESSYMSLFMLYEFNAIYGLEFAQQYIDQFESKIVEDPEGFHDFIKSPVSHMRDIPHFDRATEEGKDNDYGPSTDIRNRKTILRLASRFTKSGSDAWNIYITENDYLNEEMDTWLEKDKKSVEGVEVDNT